MFGGGVLAGGVPALAASGWEGICVGVEGPVLGLSCGDDAGADVVGVEDGC